MKEYTIKVIELHTDIVHIKASSMREALDMAHGESQCEYETLYDMYVTDESDIDDKVNQE